MPFGIGIWEILILMLVVLLVFGPKRLPEMGRSLGKGMREFKDSISGKDDEDDEPMHRRLSAELPPVEDDVPEQVEPREHDTVTRDTASRDAAARDAAARDAASRERDAV